MRKNRRTEISILVGMGQAWCKWESISVILVKPSKVIGLKSVAFSIQRQEIYIKSVNVSARQIRDKDVI